MFTLQTVNAHRLALGLLVVGALVTVVGTIWEARQRGPELAVRTYFAAVEREDLDDAIQQILPSERSAVRDRVALQLGSRYRVDVLVLGRPSLLSRALGNDGRTARATVQAEVTAAGGERWKSTSSVDLVEQAGRWYLLSPPFA